jgi:hypothetical protein
MTHIFNAEQQHSLVTFTFENEKEFVRKALLNGAKDGDRFFIPNMNAELIRLGTSPWLGGRWFASHVVSYDSLQELIDRYNRESPSE